VESWAVGVRKGDDELRNQVNAFIREYRKSGGFERLGDRYLKEMKDAFKSLGYSFFL
jgi:polar amino acid transport system substrate-binding protein